MELLGDRSEFLAAGDRTDLHIENSGSEGRGVLTTALRRGSKHFRAELVPLSRRLIEGKLSYFDVPLRYEFDLCLRSSSIEDSAPQCLAQWHGIPNRLLGGSDAHPPFLLGLSRGKYFCVNVASGKLILPNSNGLDPYSRYEKSRRLQLQSAEADIDRWVRWRFEVLWSYKKAGGWWRLFHNDKLLVEDAGPNCFNELRGAPYFQFGVYRLGEHGYRHPLTLAKIVRHYRRLRLNTLPYARKGSDHKALSWSTESMTTASAA